MRRDKGGQAEGQRKQMKHLAVVLPRARPSPAPYQLSEPHPFHQDYSTHAQSGNGDPTADFDGKGQEMGGRKHEAAKQDGNTRRMSA